VRFRPLPESLIQSFLREHKTEEQDARMLAALSSGSLARALVLRDAEPRRQRDQALGLLEPALRGDMTALWKAVTAQAGYRVSRESMRLMIEFHQLWLRDLLRARYDAAREELVHRDREKEIRAQAASLDATEIRRRLMVLEEVLKSIEGNITPELAVFSGMARLAGRHYGEAEWPAHDAARWSY
jgi:hypothetical protein